MRIAQVYDRFPTKRECLDCLEQVYWNNTPLCPYCKTSNYSGLPLENRYHCNTCNTSFKVTVGTVFHNTKIDLQKWFFAIAKYFDTNNKICIRQLGRDLKVTKDTASFITSRLKIAAINESKQMQSLVYNLS